MMFCDGGRVSEVAARRGREGSRWYNERPSPEQVVEWFQTIPLHDGMQHGDYIGGVTLIQATEKSDEVSGFDKDGMPLIRERRDLVYVPYVKVETRVAYFWRLMDVRGWIGEILPVATAGPDVGLPTGFFKYAAADPKGKTIPFVGCSMQMFAWEPMTGVSERRLKMGPPPASKIVSTATKWEVDQNALMKAETGAVGRALGMGGILVVPGSGVATAEDMQDSQVPAGASAEPTVPATTVEREPTDEELRERIGTLVDELTELDPIRLEAFQTWARERKLTLATAKGAVLRGAVRKLEKELDAARSAGATS
jgi:hypothetical protein